MIPQVTLTTYLKKFCHSLEVLRIMNESVRSQNGKSTASLKQVVDCGSQETQPNSAAAEHLKVSIESGICERSNRKQSSSEGMVQGMVAGMYLKIICHILEGLIY